MLPLGRAADFTVRILSHMMCRRVSAARGATLGLVRGAPRVVLKVPLCSAVGELPDRVLRRIGSHAVRVAACALAAAVARLATTNWRGGLSARVRE